MTTEERLVNLESMVAFYEENFQKLGKLVTELQLQMHKTEEEMEALRRQLAQMQPSTIRDASDETPPPHY